VKTRPPRHRAAAGFTLTEVIITMTIMMLATAGAMSVFLMGLRAMYKDTQRLATDATLRRLTLQVAKETIDSTEFYVFPTYQALDGTVDLVNDVAPLDPAEPDPGQIQLAAGDCLVLVTRTSADVTSNVRQFRIYYRTAASANSTAALRYYESTDYGLNSTQTSLGALLNTINLKNTPAYPGSRVLAATTRGKPKEDGSGFYPVFSTEATVATPTNESVSLNIEVINGTSTTNLLSSSSFNYTISPRK
jgi:type II secretory pathway pseudopilin PulG